MLGEKKWYQYLIWDVSHWWIHCLFECLLTFLFVSFVAAFLPAWHSVCLHTWMSLPKQTWLNIIYLVISATFYWKLLFPHLTFLKKRAALALSSFASHNTLTDCCWCIAFKESLRSVPFFFFFNPPPITRSPWMYSSPSLQLFLFFHSFLQRFYDFTRSYD